MALQIKRTRKGEYQTFHLKGVFDTSACFELKDKLNDVINHEEFHICLEFSGIAGIDASGLRFLENIHKILEKRSRKLAIYGAKSALHKLMQDRGLLAKIPTYKDVYEFEDSFQVEEREIRKKYFSLAIGSDPIRRHSCICPLCQNENIIGYLCDESVHSLCWEDNEITPQWRLTQPSDNEMDVELYEIAVCPNCFFASSKLDYFVISMPEGTIPSVLTKEQKDRLVKNSSIRQSLLSKHQKDNTKSFFSMPRDSVAGFISWQLYDRTLRDIARDKASTVAIEVARANILSAKFATSQTDSKNFMTTAHVWVTYMINNPDSNASKDLVMGYIYLISLNLALAKEKEAKATFESYMKKYGDDKFYAFWTNRAISLTDDL